MEHPLEEYCSTEHQKNLVRLRYVEGCSWNEISKRVGSDRTNIRSSLRVVEGRAARLAMRRSIIMFIRCPLATQSKALQRFTRTAT